jgi:hypothetical protein
MKGGRLTAHVVQPLYPVPPHCPYFATEQLPLPPPPLEEVVVGADEDLDVELAEV